MLKRTVAVALASALVAGCGGQESPRVAPRRSASASGVPSTPSAQTAAWKVIAKWPALGPSHTGEYNGGYYAVVDEHDTFSEASQVTEIFDLERRRILKRSADGPAWFTQSVWLTGNFAVVEDLNEEAKEIRLFAYDLTSGKPIRLDRLPEVTQPEMDVSDGRIAYITGHSATRMCLELADLATRKAVEVACGRHGDVLGDVAVSGGAVLYSSVSDPGASRRCKKVVVVRDGTPKAVPARGKCFAWSGAVLGDAVAWDEADPAAADLAMGKAYVEAGRQITTVGVVMTDTLVACGERFYWSAADGRGQRVDGMKPGEAPVTIWGPEENGVPTGLECADGRWLHMRADDISSSNLPHQFLVLDAAPAG